MTGLNILGVESCDCFYGGLKNQFKNPPAKSSFWGSDRKTGQVKKYSRKVPFWRDATILNHKYIYIVIYIYIIINIFIIYIYIGTLDPPPTEDASHHQDDITFFGSGIQKKTR